MPLSGRPPPSPPKSSSNDKVEITKKESVIEAPDDTTALAKLHQESEALKQKLGSLPAGVVSGFDPMSDFKRTSAPPKGSESKEDQKLNKLRESMCSDMQLFYKSRPWNALCGGRILSKNFDFGSATTGAEDIVPQCGPEAAKSCSQGMGTAAQGAGGTSDSAEAIMDCDTVAWRTACLNGGSLYNANKKDPGFNQRLYGRVPLDCYCACYDQCTMGQSSVLAAQRYPVSSSSKGGVGATCTLKQLKEGRCKEHPP